MTLRVSISLAATAAVLLTSLGCARGQTGPATVAITHVTVIDGTGAEPRQDHTVLIDGERIGLIGPSADINPPKTARLIDGTGKYLLPGFWDLHVHLHFGTPDVLPVFVANGITGIRELDTPMPTIDSIRASARAGALLTPRILAAGKMIEAGEPEPLLRKGRPAIAAF